jgi:hypothetical protein
MADIIYDRLSGLPPEQGERAKDMGDGTFAIVGLDIAGFPPLLSLTAVSAVGNGLVLDNVGVRNNHNVVVVVNGTVTGGKVQLQGSQDGVSWINLLYDPGSGTQVSAQTSVVLPIGPGIPTGQVIPIFLGISQLSPFRFIRAAVVTTITGGGTITAWVASAG